MPRYIVVHSTIGVTDQEEAVIRIQKMARSLPAGAKWLNSWLAMQRPRMFCEWEASDTDTLLTALEPVLEESPVEGIYEVAHIDPSWYAE